MSDREGDLYADFERATGASLTRRGGETFVPIELAGTAVEFFRSNDAVILGFDGFNLTDDGIWPLLDFIADFSGIAGPRDKRVAGSAEAAVATLANWHGPAFISFVVA